MEKEENKSKNTIKKLEDLSKEINYYKQLAESLNNQLNDKENQPDRLV